jgi:ketopantoate reductase
VAHVVILGAGAVGLTYAAFLRAAGARVTLVVRAGRDLGLPLEVADEIGGRTLTLRDVETCAIAEAPRRPDHLLVCTRGEQLAEALASLRGRVDPAVPIAVAAATFADLAALARAAGLPNPTLRLAVAFAAWPTAPGRMRVFALMKQGSTVAAEPAGDARPLALLLSRAGLPTRTAPARVFRWIYQSTLAIEVARLLAYRAAGWELDALAARPDLIALTARGMQEAARLARDGGGPVGWIASLLPRSAFALMLRHRATHASAGFREVWRHHGPKTSAQLDHLAAELLARGHAPALTDLLRS